MLYSTQHKDRRTNEDVCGLIPRYILKGKCLYGILFFERFTEGYVRIYKQIQNAIIFEIAKYPSGRSILKRCNFPLVICDAIFEAVITNKFQLQLAMSKL